MRLSRICALICMMLFAPMVAPVGSASLAVAQKVFFANTSDPAKSTVSDDLSAMGVDLSSYPLKANGSVEFLNLVEWGYGKADKYALFLYVYNPTGTQWDSVATVTMAFPSVSGSVSDIKSFDSYGLTENGRTDDGAFVRYLFSDSASIYKKVSADKRRYYLGSLYLKGKTQRCFPLGKEMDFSGLCQDGATASTLVASLSDQVVVRVDAQPFVSDCGNASVTSAGTIRNRLSESMNLNVFSVLFSLPMEMDKYGTLETVHYDYYKYRTTWMLDLNDFAYYSDVATHSGTNELGSDQRYKSWGDYKYGYFFSDILDTDDLPDIDPTTKPYADVYGNSRFFYGRGDDYLKLRIPNPAWVRLHVDATAKTDSDGVKCYSDGVHILGDGTSLDKAVLSGQDMLSYSDAYSSPDDSSLAALPRLNGKVSNRLFYVPSYSSSSKFAQYGHVDNSISSGEVGSSLVSSYLSSFLSNRKGNFMENAWAGNSVSFSNAYDWYSQEIKTSSPDIYESVLGTKSPKLLSKASDDDSDFFVSHSFDGYKSDISSFFTSHYKENVYRLTYDCGLADSYRCMYGKANDLIYVPEIWDDNSHGVCSKTDAVFDFRFIDFTFKDSDGKTYVLPAANDPFSVIGDVKTPEQPDDGFNWFLFAIILTAVVALILLAIFVKPIGYVFKLIIEVVYLVCIWWWVSLVLHICKKNPLPIDLFRK